VLGVIGVFTFAHGVSDAADNPARFGQTWQLGAFLGYNDNDFVPNEYTVLAGVARDRDVTAVNDSRLAVAHAGPDDRAVTLCTYDPIGAPIRAVLTDGRMAASGSEVVLAPNAARELHAGLGSRVTFTGAAGTKDLTVVGIGFVPASPHNDYSDGGWLTPDGYRALFAAKLKFHFALIALRPGADLDVVSKRLATVPGTQPGMFLNWGKEMPTPVAQLREVRSLPAALGVFLILLALGAAGGRRGAAGARDDPAAVTCGGGHPGERAGPGGTGVRSPARAGAGPDRVAGGLRLHPAGVRAAAGGAGHAVGGAGRAAGGERAGRVARAAGRPVADRPRAASRVIPMAMIITWLRWEMAVSALLLTGPVALLVAIALTAWPGHQAARRRIAHVLRAE
jgi:hypothetical protein